MHKVQRTSNNEYYDDFYPSKILFISQGEIVCSFEYETVCDTKLNENSILDDVPNCHIERVEKCDDAGENCVLVPQNVCTLDKVENNKV